MRTTVSVVAIGFNEQRNVERLCRSIRDQDELPMEFIFVDGHSTDCTREIAMSYADIVLDDFRTGAAGARNLGATVASGDVVLFIDSDSYASPSWVRTMHKDFDKGHVGVGGFVLPYDGKTVPQAIFHAVNIYNMVKQPFTHGGLHGSNCGYLRKPFLDAQGFRVGYTMYEDVELSQRISEVGTTIVDPSSKVWSSTRRLQQVRVFDTMVAYAKAIHDDRVKGSVKVPYFGVITH